MATHDDNVVVTLQRKLTRLGDYYGSSLYALWGDEKLAGLIFTDEEAADLYVRDNYAYCEEHDDDHGQCLADDLPEAYELQEVPD